MWKISYRRITETFAGFSKREFGGFYQKLPQLGNPFLDDNSLQRYLKRLCPDEIYITVHLDLQKFGNRIQHEIDNLGRQCESNRPYLRNFDVTGRRIDELITCHAWKRMKDIAAEEGLISIGYHPTLYKQYNRLYQMAKLFLYAPSSGLYSCPLAMTDGAAKLIMEMKKTKAISSDLMEAYDRLIGTDPMRFWTSGQWMTEQKGGSDVANATETIAIPGPNGQYQLYGYKFFSSATDADMAFTLARLLNNDGTPIRGSKGLSLFFVKLHDSDGRLNNIEIIRLKDKLGTRQLPTAELLLDGAVAEKVSDDGRGIATISDMLNITRIHNAISAAAGMRRIVMLARDYAQKRESFGKKIIDHPLHLQTLARLEVQTRGCVMFVLELARLLGLQEHQMANQQDTFMLRLLTPLAKLYSAKKAMEVISEGLECFGGLGYMEDSGLPLALRDAQVLPIWEGTTNILSLDILRILSKYGQDVLLIFQCVITQKVASAFQNNELSISAQRIHLAMNAILEFVKKNAGSDIAMELAARDLAFSLSSIFIGALLLEHATWNGATPDDIEAAKRWASSHVLVYLDTKHNTYTGTTETASLVSN